MQMKTNSNPDLGTSVDQIADLLTEEPETHDDIDEATLTNDSTDVEESDEQIDEKTMDTLDDDDSDEPEESEDEVVDTEESDDSEDDGTWESVLGVDEGQLSFDEEGNLQGINVKIDGKQDTVNVKDLIAGYQNNKVNTQKAQALAEDRKQAEAQRSQFEQEYTAKLENADILTDILGKNLVGEYESVNWEQLRVEDPAEYSALKQDYAAKAQEIQQAKQAVEQEKQQVFEQQQKQFQEQQQAFLKQQYDKTVENNPSWADNNIFTKEMNALGQFTTEQYGFSAEEFNNVFDSRIVELIKDAKAFREGRKAVSQKLQKKVPKFQKSSNGKKTANKVSKLDKLTKRAFQARGSNKRRAQSDAITELLMGEL